MSNTLIRFCSHANLVGDMEGEMLYDWSEALAKAENRPFEEVEAELKQKLVYRDTPNGKYLYETWGPQELADRINKAQVAGD